VLLLDVTPLSLGVETAGSVRLSMTRLIRAQHHDPDQEERGFSTCPTAADHPVV